MADYPRKPFRFLKVVNPRFQLTLLAVTALFTIQLLAWGFWCASSVFDFARPFALQIPGLAAQMRKWTTWYVVGGILLYGLQYLILMAVTDRIAGPFFRLQRDGKPAKFRQHDYVTRASGSKDEAGFTLLEILVAAALSIIIGLALANMTVNSSKGQTSVRLDADFTNIMNQVYIALGQPNLCGSAFVDGTGNALIANPTGTCTTTPVQANCVDVPAFALAGSAVMKTGFPATGNKVTKMRLESPILNSGNTYFWTFRVEVSKTAADGSVEGLGNGLTIRKFPVSVTTNGPTGTPAFQIQNCTGKGNESLWSTTGANIFYNTGSVGIGTNLPVAALDISGPNAAVHLSRNTVQPFGCDVAHDGSVALTSNYYFCVCKGSSTSWVKSTDGTGCVW
jgi:type II secretory pathway pseudopilin PulG